MERHRSSIIVQGNMIPYTATTPYDNDKDTDLSAFVDKLVQRLYVGNDVYTVDLESISTETTTYVIKKMELQIHRLTHMCRALKRAIIMGCLLRANLYLQVL